MYLFLSPHFDDAVLSCGGTIARLVAESKPVTVRTVMGGVPTLEQIPETPITRDLHRRWDRGDDPIQARRQEDEAAVKGLGAELVVMSVWLDCVYRRSRLGEALYPTEESIFGEIHPDDEAGRLLPFVILPQTEPIYTLYAPLGAGHHVDHQVTRNWALKLREQFPWLALEFYEEYPYTEDAGAVEAALSHFAAGWRLEPEVVRLDEAHVAAKIRAIACYESQISTFWESVEAMEAATRRAMWDAAAGSFVERYWRLL
ncbi:MAG: PIG-L family deacetylase [Anaerolineae bacterium]|nr:PIG-L family deacetylase [Anaerolineae bacterium]